MLAACQGETDSAKDCQIKSGLPTARDYIWLAAGLWRGGGGKKEGDRFSQRLLVQEMFPVSKEGMSFVKRQVCGEGGTDSAYRLLN